MKALKEEAEEVKAEMEILEEEAKKLKREKELLMEREKLRIILLKNLETLSVIEKALKIMMIVKSLY